MDKVSKQKRSEIMRAIKGRDTKIEELFRKSLWRMGYRYRKNVASLYGKPDVVFTRKKIAIFIDSCFWHGCPYHCRMPHSNRAYWFRKIKRNKERDKEATKQLRKDGWKVLRFWEHSIHYNLAKCTKKIAEER